MAGASIRAEEEKLLVDFNKQGVESQIKTNLPTREGVEFMLSYGKNGKVLDVKCKPIPSNIYPGVVIDFDPPMDLSKYGRVEVDFTNYSQDNIKLCFRVDNAGYWKDEPWNSEFKIVKPGKSETVTVFFGYSWEKPGFKLDPSKIVSIMIFVDKPKNEQIFRIERIRVTGKPGDKPQAPIETEVKK